MLDWGGYFLYECYEILLLLHPLLRFSTQSIYHFGHRPTDTLSTILFWRLSHFGDSSTFNFDKVNSHLHSTNTRILGSLARNPSFRTTSGLYTQSVTGIAGDNYCMHIQVQNPILVTFSTLNLIYAEFQGEKFKIKVIKAKIINTWAAFLGSVVYSGSFQD